MVSRHLLKNSSFLFIVLIILIFLTTQTTAVDFNKEYSFNLLSVSHSSNGSMTGDLAKLYLTIKPGTGSVFIESYPTAKIDTQVATRLAKEIACEFSDENCDNYDFFYTIKADTSLIGGPSAGGATALLTLSALEDIDLREDVAMTGAISSGGIITPVAGIPEKVAAADKNNLGIVIIPFLNIVTNETKKTINDALFELKETTKYEDVNKTNNNTNKNTNNTSNNSNNQTNQNTNNTNQDTNNTNQDTKENSYNQTNNKHKTNNSENKTKTIENKTNKDDFKYRPFVSLDEFHNTTIKIEPVLSLNEALYFASKKKKPIDETPVVSVPKQYTFQMRKTADQLCQRTKDLLEEISIKNKTETILNESYAKQLFNLANNRYNESITAHNTKHYYPEASYCFSANLNLRKILLNNKNQNILKENLVKLKESINDVDKQVESFNLSTFSDVETYAIVKERLLESREYLDKINTSSINSDELAMAIERYYSAVAWSGFFGLEGQELEINKNNLAKACNEEIKNVETRLNYLKTILPESYFKDVKSNLKYAYSYSNNKEYALCLFKATKTKADADLFLSTMLIQNNSITDVISAKQKRTSKLLSQEEKLDIFPILGYSYFDYVNVLVENDPSSAIIFSEYALSLSDVQDYFPRKTSRNSITSKLTFIDLGIFLSGFFIGAFIIFLIMGKKSKKIT